MAEHEARNDAGGPDRTGSLGSLSGKSPHEKGWRTPVLPGPPYSPGRFGSIPSTNRRLVVEAPRYSPARTHERSA